MYLFVKTSLVCIYVSSTMVFVEKMTFMLYIDFQSYNTNQA